MAVSKTSLSVGALIREILLADTEVSARCSRIFPVATDQAILPYILYRRTSMEPYPQKSGQPNADSTAVEVLCFTEKYGTHQCILAAREALMRGEMHLKVDDSIIEQVLRNGKAGVDEKVVSSIRDTAVEYVNGIMRSLREHEYDHRLMRLWFMGGGACLIRNFGTWDSSHVTFIDDIKATAKGYYQLAAKALCKRGVRFEEE